MGPIAVLLIMAGVVSAYTFMDQGWVNGDPYEQLAGDLMYADDFVACDGTLEAVQVWAGDVGGEVDLIIQIYQGGTEPSGSPLYAETFETSQGDWTSVGFPISTITRALPSGWSVDWGQTYWITIQLDANDAWLIGSDEQYGLYPLLYYENEKWQEWYLIPDEYSRALYIMVSGETEGTSLESDTWGAIKALW